MKGLEQVRSLGDSGGKGSWPGSGSMGIVHGASGSSMIEADRV